MVGSFAARFSSWFYQTCTIEAWLGTFDDNGQPQFAAGVQFDCRMESKVRMVRDTTGAERASNVTLFVLGGPFDPHDRVTMPNGFKGPSQPPTINVSNVEDVSEFSHCEFYL